MKVVMRCARAIAWMSAVAVCAPLVPSGIARAATSASVTVNFSGDYIGSTRNVLGSSDMSVTLPTLSAQLLTAAGQTAGETVFTIPIQCDSETTGVRTYFENWAATDPTTGNLNPQDVTGQSTAQNVQVSLRNPDGSPIKVGDRSTVAVVPVTSRPDDDQLHRELLRDRNGDSRCGADIRDLCAGTAMTSINRSRTAHDA